MFNILSIFGRSPFGPLVEHARKVHACVALVRPLAEAILARDTARVAELQHEISRTEYEADQIKDQIRQRLPHRYYLPVKREDVANFLRQMDKIADGAEDFAVIATFRPLTVPQSMHADFLALVDKVLQVNESLLEIAEKLAELQKEAFVGPDAEDLLDKIQGVCHMEWESDKLSRRLARRMYAIDGLDAVTIMLLDKLTHALSSLADHAENVGKTLRLMIIRK